VGSTDRPPKWIKPQLTRLVDEAPAGAGWLHEIKYDGYRMHARIDGGKAALLTRTGLDWSHRYRRTIDEQCWQIVRGLLCSGRPNHARVQVDDLLLFSLPPVRLSGSSGWAGSAVRPVTLTRLRAVENAGMVVGFGTVNIWTRQRGGLNRSEAGVGPPREEGPPASRTLLPRRWFGRGAFRRQCAGRLPLLNQHRRATQTKVLPSSTPPALNAKSWKEAWRPGAYNWPHSRMAA
jgi:hypothetical protein